MATEVGPQDARLDASASRELVRLLREQPWNFEFFEAVRVLERLYAARSPVGLFADPGKEVVRFAAHQSLAFPASDIQALDPSREPWRMTVNLMGLTGPMGLLPRVYTELIQERQRARDFALRDFLDLFNHRMISFLFRAWKKSRLPVRYEDEQLNTFLLSLVGLGTAGLRERQEFHDATLLYYSGLVSLETRSAVALEQLVEDYFDVCAEVIQFIGAWYELAPDSQCRFEDTLDPSEQLGAGAVVGDAIWDQQSRARIRIGPLPMRRYAEFLPGAPSFRKLAALTRFYSRGQVDFELQLVLERRDVPACEIGGAAEPVQLGWTTWMKTAPRFSRDPDDTVLLLQ